MITVESCPGETAIFDPGFPEFKDSPGTAWTPCTDKGAHRDEYISTGTYTNDTRWGSFLTAANGTATYRLLTYSKLEDLRACNESFIKVLLADPRPGGGPLANDDPNTPEDETLYKYLWTYRGPGLWYDTATQKIHIRLSNTHLDGPGVTNYTGETDPRKLPLSITYYTNKATSIRGDYMTFRRIVFQNGGNSMCGVSSEHVTLEHCTFNASRKGLGITATKYLKIEDCEFNGRLGPWVSRDDVKAAYNYISDITGQQNTNGTCNMTCDILLCVSGTDNDDWEVVNCEFRNGHDAMQVSGDRIRIHHNLFENMNDEVLYFNVGGEGVTYEDIRVYNNVIRKSLHALSFFGGTVIGPRYIYRNIIDQRLPVLGYHRMVADNLPIWRVAGDFKMGDKINEYYVYQNTFLLRDTDPAQCSEAFTGSTSDTKTRRFMNNLHMTISTDEPLYTIPDPACTTLSNGNIWCRRMTNATKHLFTYVAYDGNPRRQDRRPAGPLGARHLDSVQKQQRRGLGDKQPDRLSAVRQCAGLRSHRRCGLQQRRLSLEVHQPGPRRGRRPDEHRLARQRNG